MAVEIFLKLDGIAGEAQGHGHAGEIDIFSFSLGASNPSTAALGGGSGAGKVDISSLSVQKQVDKASSTLFQKCCAGQHLAKGKLTVREAGGDAPVEYFTMDMEQVFIDSVSWGGSAGGGKPSESLSLSFAKVTITYTPQKATGGADSPVIGSWNVKTNQKS